MSLELNWCMKEGLEEATIATWEEVPSTSVCPMIQTTTILDTNLEFKDLLLCTELNMKQEEEGHSQLFMTTMSLALCAMLQRGWQSQ